MAYLDTLYLSSENTLLTVSEAAEFLHVHANTLRRWSDIGLLESYRISDRGDRRFVKAELIRFLNDYNNCKNNTQIKGKSIKRDS